MIKGDQLLRDIEVSNEQKSMSRNLNSSGIIEGLTTKYLKSVFSVNNMVAPMVVRQLGMSSSKRLHNN